MTRFSWIPTIVAVLLLTGVCVAHGLWNDRWSTAVDLDPIYGPKVAAISPKIGDWQGVPRPEDAAGAGPNETNSVWRYTQAGTGRSVLVSLTYGKPKEVAIHTPDMCYPASGYEMIGGISEREVKNGAESAAFYSADFRNKPGQDGAGAFRVQWSWSADGKWAVSREPRLWYGRSPYLFKLYLIHPITSASGGPDAEAYQAFNESLLVELNRRLFDR